MSDIFTPENLAKLLTPGTYEMTGYYRLRPRIRLSIEPDDERHSVRFFVRDGEAVVGCCLVGLKEWASAENRSALFKQKWATIIPKAEQCADEKVRA